MSFLSMVIISKISLKHKFNHISPATDVWDIILGCLGLSGLSLPREDWKGVVSVCYSWLDLPHLALA